MTMKYSKASLFLIVLFFTQFICLELLAQGGQGRGGSMADRPAIGILKGKVVDDLNGAAIEYSSIAVISMRDSTLAGGTISDPRGNFRIDKIKTGRYSIRIQFIGYETRLINDVFIKPDSPEVNLGTIKLHNKATNISGVEITAEKEMMVSNLDKRIINVDKSIAAIGGSAVEVMQNIPSVTVDAEGNVSLRGSNKVTILVDGKPSGLAEISSSDLLQQIPASSIESIEVITNPSVRYDPDGASGIINIVLKKKSLQGLNGQISATAGTGDRYNGSLNLNLRQNRFNAFAGYDVRRGQFGSTGETARFTTYDNVTSKLIQYQKMDNQRSSNNLNTGFDFLIDNNNSLTLSFQYRNMDFDNEGNVLSEKYNSRDILDSIFNRYSKSTRGIESFNYNVSYKKTFAAKGKELTADFMVTDNSMIGAQDIIETESLDTILQYAGSANTNLMYMLQSNYVTSFGENGRIETGFKSTIKDMEMKNYLKEFDYDLNEWVLDPLANNYFDYFEQIHAIYGVYSSFYEKLKYQVGLRAEHVISNSSLTLTNEKFDRAKTSLYPSVHISYENSPARQFQLSYSRRVSRPSNRQLNPFVDYSNSSSISYGNPKLDPEFINSYELGMINSWGKNSLNSSIFYRYTTGIIDRIVVLLEDGVTATTYENLTRGTSYGLEVIGNREFASWFKANANISLFKNIINASEAAGLERIEGNMWTAKINLTFNFLKNATFMLAGNYKSPEIEAQEREEEVYFADAALRYDFLKGKASLSMRVSDIFNSRRFSSQTTGDGFFITNDRQMETRIGYLGFTYRINNYNRQKEKERNGQGESEMEEF